MDNQELRTNKQELINKYELIKNVFNFDVVATDDIISDLKRLDEPQKPVVEEEKRYLVKVKNVLTRQGALNRNKKSGRFIFSNPEENSLYDTKFTREELEGAGFGWVFDCPGIEVEEVKG